MKHKKNKNKTLLTTSTETSLVVSKFIIVNSKYKDKIYTSFDKNILNTLKIKYGMWANVWDRLE